MKRFIKDWDELLAYEKVFRILTMVFAVATMALVIMSLHDAVDMAIGQLCMGLMILCQGIFLWRKHRRKAISSFCSAAFIFLVVIVFAFL